MEARFRVDEPGLEELPQLRGRLRRRAGDRASQSPRTPVRAGLETRPLSIQTGQQLWPELGARSRVPARLPARMRRAERRRARSRCSPRGRSCRGSARQVERRRAARRASTRALERLATMRTHEAAGSPTGPGQPSRTSTARRTRCAPCMLAKEGGVDAPEGPPRGHAERTSLTALLADGTEPEVRAAIAAEPRRARRAAREQRRRARRPARSSSVSASRAWPSRCTSAPGQEDRVRDAARRARGVVRRQGQADAQPATTERLVLLRLADAHASAGSHRARAARAGARCCSRVLVARLSDEGRKRTRRRATA